jgi:hypothetical protein
MLYSIIQYTELTVTPPDDRLTYFKGGIMIRASVGVSHVEVDSMEEFMG